MASKSVRPPEQMPSGDSAALAMWAAEWIKYANSLDRLVRQLVPCIRHARTCNALRSSCQCGVNDALAAADEMVFRPSKGGDAK